MIASPLLFAALLSVAQPADLPPAAQAESAADLTSANLAARRVRIADLIRAGRRERWLEPEEVREAFQSLRSIRNQEAQYRGMTNRELTDAERADLHRRLSDLAQSLRWKRTREGGGHRQTHP